MSRSAPTAEDGPNVATSPDGQSGRTPAVGKLQIVAGLATVKRGETINAQPVVGLPVYEGDIIETGSDGLVVVAFVDGSAFRLHPSTCEVLDEFICSREKPSAVLRVLKGVFGFIAGRVASGGRLLIETPLGQIRSAASAAGIGSLSFGILAVLLVRELKAAGADIALLDD